MAFTLPDSLIVSDLPCIVFRENELMRLCDVRHDYLRAVKEGEEFKYKFNDLIYFKIVDNDKLNITTTITLDYKTALQMFDYVWYDTIAAVPQ